MPLSERRRARAHTRKFLMHSGRCWSKQGMPAKGRRKRRTRVTDWLAAWLPGCRAGPRACQSLGLTNGLSTKARSTHGVPHKAAGLYCPPPSAAAAATTLSTPPQCAHACRCLHPRESCRTAGLLMIRCYRHSVSPPQCAHARHGILTTLSLPHQRPTGEPQTPRGRTAMRVHTFAPQPNLPHAPRAPKQTAERDTLQTDTVLAAGALRRTHQKRPS